MIVQQLLLSFIASALFGMIFNIPKKLLINSGFVGMVGWMVYFFFAEHHLNNVLATFIAAFFVALLSNLFARLYKTPATIFSVSGIIPLVPGERRLRRCATSFSMTTMRRYRLRPKRL